MPCQGPHHTGLLYLLGSLYHYTTMLTMLTILTLLTILLQAHTTLGCCQLRDTLLSLAVAQAELIGALTLTLTLTRRAHRSTNPNPNPNPNLLRLSSASS